jgi:lysophospholipase L1-like esterase
MAAQSNDPMGSGSWGISMPTYATYLSKGGLRRVRQAGVPGNTSAQMLARFDTDVTPYAPSAVVIMAGTNDSNDANPIPVATYAANMQALVTKCRAIAATPILCTLPPNVVSTARRKLVINYNAWLRRYCKNHGVVLVDLYNLLVDPATGDYLAAYGTASNDKTHPINAGYPAMGQALWNAISGLIPPAAPLLPYENGDANNLITNGLFLSTTGSGTSLMPTGWSVQSSVHPTGCTGSLVTGDATIKGNWWKVVADGTATSTDNEFQTVNGIIPGHTYAHVGRFKATGLRNADTGSGSQALCGVAFNGTLLNNAYDFRAVAVTSYDVAEGMFHQEVVAPSDASTALVRFQLLNTTAGAGTLQVAQWGLYDLTAMGLV